MKTPGDLIDDFFIAFLVQDPTHYFKKEEFVGYLRSDGRYILAQVVEEIDSKSDCLLFNFGRKYKINLGRNIPVLVGTPDLFKFVTQPTEVDISFLNLLMQIRTGMQPIRQVFLFTEIVITHRSY